MVVVDDGATRMSTTPRRSGGAGGAIPQQTNAERAAAADAESLRQLRQAVQLTAEAETLGTETMECVSSCGARDAGERAR